MAERFVIRPFSPSDPARVAARADFALEHRLTGEPLFGPQRPEGPCWTLTQRVPGRWPRPVACGGFEPQGQGRFAAWLYAADLCPRGWVAVRRAFAAMVKDSGARRVEATVRCGEGEDRAAAYAQAVGMAREGLLKSFGPDGADYWLFAGVY